MSCQNRGQRHHVVFDGLFGGNKDEADLCFVVAPLVEDNAGPHRFGRVFCDHLTRRSVLDRLSRSRPCSLTSIE